MDNKKVKPNSRPAHVLRRTGVYAAAAFVLCFIAIFFINNSIVFGNEGNSVSAEAATSSGITITGVPADAEDISFSYDDKYCTYRYDSQIFVKDIETNTTVGTISGSGIEWSLLMNDRDEILYFTQDNNTLSVMTYNIDNKTSIKQVSFTMPSGSKIKAVDYSNSTNLIYLNLEQIKSGKSTDTVYSINIMKKLQKVSSSNIVNNMVLLNNTGTLYFEDADNHLFDLEKRVVDLQTGHLIGCDAKDNVYVQSVDDRSIISVISGSETIKTLTLPDTAYMGFYSNKSNVYVIYGDYIINLSGDMSAKFTYNSDLTFIGLGGSDIYFRDVTGNIVALASSI